jgi:hypothetical protein
MRTLCIVLVCITPPKSLCRPFRYIQYNSFKPLGIYTRVTNLCTEIYHNQPQLLIYEKESSGVEVKVKGEVSLVLVQIGALK